MNIGWRSVLGATVALAPATAGAQDGGEVAVGVLDHAVNWPLPQPPAGQIYAGTEESGTVDAQLVYRTPPLGFALKPRLAAKLTVNTGGRTSFASVGAEWRQHMLRRRLYGQIGIGLAIHDGYIATADPFDLAIGSAGFVARYRLYMSRTGFGSRVLFNPNLSVGLRLTDRVAIEGVWEHFSHAGLFGSRNPGIDSLGARIVIGLGRRP